MKKIIFIFILSGQSLAFAQNLSVLYSFNGTNGANPSASLVQMPNGLLYGMASGGGTNNAGTMFQLTTTGNLTTMGLFNVDGASPAFPTASLLAISGSVFYTTSQGGGPTNTSYKSGAGLFFEITTNGTITTLATFGLGSLHLQGSHPHSAPVMGPDNNFYGTTHSGNQNSDGVIYQYETNGNLNTFYIFGTNNYSGFNDGADNPLIVGTDGKLYGTVAGSGTNNLGWIFNITTNGQFTKLASFNTTNGANPSGSLIQTGNGNFYGTTFSGGTNNLGTVFKLTNGIITTLTSFNGTNGANPQAGLFQASDGYFYGTTYNGGTSNLGTVFQITPSGAMNTLASFTGQNGANPGASLIQGQDGRLYGTTVYGGTYSNGVVFAVSLPVLPSVGITTAGNKIVLSWPTNATSFTLQSITNLISGSWSNVTTGISTVGTNFMFTNAVNGNASFFRLKQ